MAQIYRRPVQGVPLAMEPQLASWDAAGQPSQTRLAGFLAHVETVAAPMLTGIEGRLAVEMAVGLPGNAPLTTGGRDLDNYLYPVAQRLSPARLAAVFGRKVHGSSWLAIGPALPDVTVSPARYATRLVGSYVRQEWKQTLRDRLLRAGTVPSRPGPLAVDIAIVTGPGRNWTHVWKPLIDALGPILGEDPNQPFHPRDDRIVSLGLHHTVDAGIGHDVIVEIWHAEL